MIKLTNNILGDDLIKVQGSVKYNEYDKIDVSDIIKKELKYSVSRHILKELCSINSKFYLSNNISSFFDSIIYSEHKNILISPPTYYKWFEKKVTYEQDRLKRYEYRDFNFTLEAYCYGKNIYFSVDIPDNYIYLIDDILLYQNFSELKQDNFNLTKEMRSEFKFKINNSDKIIIIENKNDPNYDEFIFNKRKKTISKILNK